MANLNVSHLQLTPTLSHSVTKSSTCSDVFGDNDTDMDVDVDLDEGNSDPYKIKVPQIDIPHMNAFDVSIETLTLSESLPPSPTPCPSVSAADSPSIIVSGCGSESTLSPLPTTPVITSLHGIYFDMIRSKHLVASNGFSDGCHEWTVTIQKSDSFRQEIGIVSELIDLEKDVSIKENAVFGARALYGSIEQTFYYASFNVDNTCRCEKTLDDANGAWSDGDEVTVRLDMEKGSISFFLNGVRVRKSMSVQRNVVYYPIISYSGQCRYEITHYDCKTSHK
eukprot:270626_1